MITKSKNRNKATERQFHLGKEICKQREFCVDICVM